MNVAESSIHPAFLALLRDLDAFIAGQITPREFERRFFANNEFQVEPDYDTYQQLFYAVEDYVDDPTLRRGPQDLDEAALMAAAVVARTKFTEELTDRGHGT